MVICRTHLKARDIKSRYYFNIYHIILTLVKVETILSRLFTNNTIDKSKFPVFGQYPQHKRNERHITFFLNTNYDFKNQVWNSGFFKIHEIDWVTSDTVEYKFPILGKVWKVYLDELSLLWSRLWSIGYGVYRLYWGKPMRKTIDLCSTEISMWNHHEKIYAEERRKNTSWTSGAWQNILECR